MSKVPEYHFRQTAEPLRIRCRNCDEFFPAKSMACWYCDKCRRLKSAERRATKHPATEDGYRWIVVCKICGEKTKAQHPKRKWCDACADLGAREAKNARLRRLAAEARTIRLVAPKPLYPHTCECGCAFTSHSPRSLYCETCVKKRNTRKSERHKKRAAARRKEAAAAALAAKLAANAEQLAKAEAPTVEKPVKQPAPPKSPKPPKEPKAKVEKTPKPPKEPKEPKAKVEKPAYVPEPPRKPAGGMCPVCYDMPHVRAADGCPGCGEARVERQPVRASYSGSGCGLAQFPAVMR